MDCDFCVACERCGKTYGDDGHDHVGLGQGEERHEFSLCLECFRVVSIAVRRAIYADAALYPSGIPGVGGISNPARGRADDDMSTVVHESVEEFYLLEEAVGTVIYGEDGEGYPRAEHRERMQQVADAARALVPDAPIREEPWEGSADYWANKAQYWEALQAMIGEWGPE